MDDELGQKLHRLLLMHLPDAPELLPSGSTLIELGLSSVSIVNLVLDLENDFDIEFPDSLLTAATFQTVATLESAIRGLLAFNDVVDR